MPVPILNSETIRRHSVVSFILLLLFSGSSIAVGQEFPSTTNAGNLQFGATARLVMDIPIRRGKPSPSQPAKSPLPPYYYRLSLSAGVSSNFIVSEIHPSLHFEMLMYNGGLGTQIPTEKDGSRTTFDFILATTVTAGLHNLYKENDRSRLEHRDVPLHFFYNYAAPPLQNPFDYSVSFGSDLILTTGLKRRNQRVGFFNLQLMTGHKTSFQLSYYNDGGPFFTGTKLGDGRDRYYTGGLLFSYHEKTNQPVTLIEAGFQKFTGASNNAFETANELNFTFVDYKDPAQRAFNKSLWIINVANPHKFWGGYLGFYNYDGPDIQHYLHLVGQHAYHASACSPTMSIGGSLYYEYSQNYVR